MSARVRRIVVIATAVLLTAAVTGCTMLLPTAAHAAEPTRVAHSSSDTTDTGVLAWGAAAFIGTGLVLMIGINRHGRHRH
ncbi:MULTISPECIES: hypothetical protein [Streptacidiphilus]|uniref:Uncharacterized protein n=1 Tax=Streptacidiphilus cavernicola TaxID=3342716 RepID=A0ABV6UFZ1_9ACTN|nr:hypothetical protein [Streptacidiphilus jeojiense]